MPGDVVHKTERVPFCMLLASELGGDPLHTTVHSTKIRPRKVKVNTLSKLLGSQRKLTFSRQRQHVVRLEL